MKKEYIKRAYKITLEKLDEFLALVGYRRKEINGIGYILNNFGEETGMMTWGTRIEIRDERVFGKNGMGVVYFSLEACKLEFRQEEGSKWKTLCLLGKKEKNIFLQMYDDRKLSTLKEKGE